MSHARTEVKIAELRRNLETIENNLDRIRAKTNLDALDLQILRIVDDGLKAQESDLLRVGQKSNAIQAAELLQLSKEHARLRQLVQSVGPS